LVLGSCGSPEAGCEVRVVLSALTNGAARAEYLQLEPWQEHALVDIQLKLVDPPSAGRCSGLLVADRTILTAKHCARGETSAQIRVSFVEDTPGLAFETTARIVAVHPDADVMLLELDESPSPSIDVVPIPVARALPAGLEPGSLVQLGGFGYDADGGSGTRTFLAEQVLEIGDASIAVGAAELAGACFGDSGGPLLVRADNGQVSALGVLSSGTASCFGRDSYARVDTVSAWLTVSTRAGLADDPSRAVDRPYETLGYEGRCFDDRAVWFDAGHLQASTCHADWTCGWSREAGGYRCLAAATDPCQGITDVGICKNGSALRCVRGQVESNPCASCGFSCERSPKTGGPICLTVREGVDTGND